MRQLARVASRHPARGTYRLAEAPAPSPSPRERQRPIARHDPVGAVIDLDQLAEALDQLLAPSLGQPLGEPRMPRMLILPRQIGGIPAQFCSARPVDHLGERPGAEHPLAPPLEVGHVGCLDAGDGRRRHLAEASMQLPQ
jgi:hypothetical protein